MERNFTSLGGIAQYVPPLCCLSHVAGGSAVHCSPVETAGVRSDCQGKEKILLCSCDALSVMVPSRHLMFPWRDPLEILHPQHYDLSCSAPVGLWIRYPLCHILFSDLCRLLIKSSHCQTMCIKNETCVISKWTALTLMLPRVGENLFDPPIFHLS